MINVSPFETFIELAVTPLEVMLNPVAVIQSVAAVPVTPSCHSTFCP
jgi:hypothetical protein